MARSDATSATNVAAVVSRPPTSVPAVIATATSWGLNRTLRIGTLSPDGATWTTPDSSLSFPAASLAPAPDGTIVAAGESYCIVGNCSSSHVAYTRDGHQWTDVALPGLDESDVVLHDGRRFLAVADIGTVYASADGAKWTRLGEIIPDWIPYAFRAAACSDGRYVAVGSNGRAATSIDGVTWTLAANPTPESLDAVVVGSQFVAAGVNGRILTSTDGLTWAIATSNTTSTLLGLAATGVGYLAVGVNGTNLTSY